MKASPWRSLKIGYFSRHKLTPSPNIPEGAKEQVRLDSLNR